VIEPLRGECDAVFVAADADRLPLTRVGEKRERDALFVQLVRDHRPLVERLCRLLLRNNSDVEDAVQQTFLLAYQSLVSGTRPRRPRAWLSTIARHECWVRRHQRRERAVPETQPSGGLDPSEQAVLNAKLRALIAGVGRLPARQRQALVLREFGGFSYRQLAAALGISESAVDALLIRARRSLRRGGFPLLTLPFSMSLPRSLQRALRRLTDGTQRLRAFTGAQATAVAAATTVVPLAATAVLAATAAPIGREVHASARSAAEGLRELAPASNVEYRIMASAGTGTIRGEHRGSTGAATAAANALEVLESVAARGRENIEIDSSRRSGAREPTIVATAPGNQPADEQVSKPPNRSDDQSGAHEPTPEKLTAPPATTPPSSLPPEDLSLPPEDQSEDGATLPGEPSIDHPLSTPSAPETDPAAPATAPNQADQPPTEAAQATPAVANSDSPAADRPHDASDQNGTLDSASRDADPAPPPVADETAPPPSASATTPAAPTTEPEATASDASDETNAEADQAATKPTHTGSSSASEREQGRPGARGTVDGATPGADPAPQPRNKPRPCQLAGGPAPAAT
jgi:RNA polymerase sigma-70 factor (ECF subfamily)